MGKGEVEVAKALLEAGADPNVVNHTVRTRQYGRTPLHYAAETQSLPLLTLLLAHGAVSLKDQVISPQKGHKPSDLTSNPHLLQQLFLTPSQHLRSLSSDSPIFNVCDDVEDIPAISELTFEKLDMSKTSTWSEGQTTASHGRRRSQEMPQLTHRVQSSLQISLASINQSDDSPVDPEVESPTLLFTGKPRERTFSFGKVGEKKSFLYNWLSMYRLEGLFDTLIDSGYDDFEQILAQMHTELPITSARLQAIGISRPGHRLRLLAALELEQKSQPALKEPRPKMSLQCCGSGAGVLTERSLPTLGQWLEKLGLGTLYADFVEAGFEELEPILAVMKSSYSLTEPDLQSFLHISKPGHRHRILSKLYEDSRFFDPFQRPYGNLRAALEAERREDREIGKSVSCDLCLTM